MYQQGTWTTKMPVRHTVLREGEIFKSREQEFLRAKDFFYRFTAKDSLSMYELDQIILLSNEELERVFAREYFAFIEKYSHSGVPDVFKLPGTDDDVRFPVHA